MTRSAPIALPPILALLLCGLALAACGEKSEPEITGVNDDVEFKIWLSEDVPGGIVKRVRTSKFKGASVAETTIELVSFEK